MVLAGKDYSSRAISDPLPSARDPGRDPPAFRPGRQAQEARAIRRPCAFDRKAYKRRSTVERRINKLQQWRGVATRYDKTATVYVGGLHIARHLHLVGEVI